MKKSPTNSGIQKGIIHLFTVPIKSNISSCDNYFHLLSMSTCVNFCSYCFGSGIFVIFCLYHRRPDKLLFSSTFLSQWISYSNKLHPLQRTWLHICDHYYFLFPLYLELIKTNKWFPCTKSMVNQFSTHLWNIADIEVLSWIKDTIISRTYYTHYNVNKVW